MDLGEIRRGVTGRIHLPQGRYQWRGLVKKAMKLSNY